MIEPLLSPPYLDPGGPGSTCPGTMVREGTSIRQVAPIEGRETLLCSLAGEYPPTPHSDDSRGAAKCVDPVTSKARKRGSGLCRNPMDIYLWQREGCTPTCSSIVPSQPYFYPGVRGGSSRRDICGKAIELRSHQKFVRGPTEPKISHKSKKIENPPLTPIS